MQQTKHFKHKHSEKSNIHWCCSLKGAHAHPVNTICYEAALDAAAKITQAGAPVE
jgi:hypothetical protein